MQRGRAHPGGGCAHAHIDWRALGCAGKVRIPNLARMCVRGAGGGRESALWHAHLRTRCARAHMRSACYTRAPHTHTHGADCRLQNRRSQAVKTMFGKPRKRWYRESSICARAGAVVRESAPYAHMRTRCADAQMRKCTAHARICAALLPCAHTHAHTRRRVHSCIQPKYIYIFPASLKNNARPCSRPACTSYAGIKQCSMIQHAHDPCQRPQRPTSKTPCWVLRALRECPPSLLSNTRECPPSPSNTTRECPPSPLIIQGNAHSLLIITRKCPSKYHKGIRSSAQLWN